MTWLLKSAYEKHAEKLQKKLLKIIKVLDSSELRHLCLNTLRKVPKNGLKLFDSDYNLIKRFSTRISHEDYLLFFNHYHYLGKIPDMKLARYLIKIELLEKDDPDYTFIKDADSVLNDDFTLVTEVPRKQFPPEIIERVLKIQRYRCAVPRCGFPKNSWKFLEKDHIKGRDDNSITNCQMLCPFHHRLKTKMEGIKRTAGRQISGSKNNLSRTIRKTSSSGRKTSRAVRKPTKITRRKPSTKRRTSSSSRSKRNVSRRR